jgi:hypothetical protein
LCRSRPRPRQTQHHAAKANDSVHCEKTPFRGESLQTCRWRPVDCPAANRTTFAPIITLLPGQLFREPPINPKFRPKESMALRIRRKLPILFSDPAFFRFNLRGWERFSDSSDMRICTDSIDYRD